MVLGEGRDLEERDKRQETRCCGFRVSGFGFRVERWELGVWRWKLEGRIQDLENRE